MCCIVASRRLVCTMPLANSSRAAKSALLIDSPRSRSVGRKVFVAAALCHPVRVAHRRAGNYFDGPVQRRRHRLDDDELLIILLPEAGGLGIQDVEQFCHHLADALKMVRPDAAFENGAEARHVEVHHGRQIRRVHLGFRWIENQVDAGVAAFGQIGFDGTRIFLKILARAELRRVDKNADRHLFRMFFGDINQRQMSAVQGTHCGNERQASQFLALAAAIGDGLSDDHLIWQMYHAGPGSGYHCDADQKPEAGNFNEEPCA